MTGPNPLNPPTMRTLPLGSSVAAEEARGEAMEPVVLQVPDAGLYTSALSRPDPPAMRTLPLLSSVAVCPPRPEFMAPVEAHEPGHVGSPATAKLWLAVRLK